jgi:hypothetical protein
MRAAYEATWQKSEDAITLDLSRGDDPWLVRTGWREYLRGFDRPALLGLIDTGVQSESYEACVMAEVREVLKRAQDVVAISNTFVRSLILTIHPSSPSQSFLRAYADGGLNQGVRAWQQIVLFFLRTRNSSVTPEFSLTPLQQGYLDECVRVARVE